MPILSQRDETNRNRLNLTNQKAVRAPCQPRSLSIYRLATQHTPIEMRHRVYRMDGRLPIRQDGDFTHSRVADFLDLTKLAYIQTAAVEQEGSDGSAMGNNHDVFSTMFAHEFFDRLQQTPLEVGKSLSPSARHILARSQPLPLLGMLGNNLSRGEPTPCSYVHFAPRLRMAGSHSERCPENLCGLAGTTQITSIESLDAAAFSTELPRELACLGIARFAQRCIGVPLPTVLLVPEGLPMSYQEQSNARIHPDLSHIMEEGFPDEQSGLASLSTAL